MRVVQRLVLGNARGCVWGVCPGSCAQGRVLSSQASYAEVTLRLASFSRMLAPRAGYLSA